MTHGIGFMCFLLGYLSVSTENVSIPACESKIFCQGDLLKTVQMAKIFPDSKTFVDMSLKSSPDKVLEAFSKLNHPISKETLQKFTGEHFSGPGEEFEDWLPEENIRLPKFLQKISDPLLRDFAWDLCRTWRDLGRKIKEDVRDNPDRYSLLYLPHPFIVPGGRFRETYYWDTYWVVKGLLLCEMHNTVRGMLENFMLFIKRFGFIPNGGRVYYTRRSQPPFFIPMMYEYYRATNDTDFVLNNIVYMEKEYQFWIQNRSVEMNKENTTFTFSIYATDITSPRPESYSEDFKTVSDSSREPKQLYRDIASAAESGWDFSSRWFSREKGQNLTLSSITTTNIVPVDLNSILCMNEMILASIFNLTGNKNKTEEYTDRHAKRSQAIQNVLWNPERGVWQDYDVNRGTHRDYYYLSNIHPLFSGCITNDILRSKRDEMILRYLKNVSVLNFKGGLPTSLDQTGQQWDFPNGWPPLQHMAIMGLSASDNAEMNDVAYDQAQNWIRSNWIGWKHTRNMFEKYSTVSPGTRGGGGEYQVQEGFGWTNGVVLDLLNKYGHKMTAEQDCNIYSSMLPQHCESEVCQKEPVNSAERDNVFMFINLYVTLTYLVLWWI